MIVVTGGAGFIGSVLIWKLNQEGFKDILVVDEKDISDRKRNIEQKQYTDYMDKETFIDSVKRGKIKGVTAVLHMGACSATTMMDAEYLDRNNFLYTRDLAIWCVNTGIHFLYASSAATYGDGALGYSDDDAVTPSLKPLNLYGKSKQDFDVWALRSGYLNKITGFKFFNVFGPNEYHKGDMRSVPHKAYGEVKRTGTMELFKSYKPEYADGQQKRDFIYVKDVADVVYHFFSHREQSGLLNVGTGCARSWVDLAHALFGAMGKTPDIRFVEMPELLKPRYQYFTEADVSKLRATGYTAPFTTLEEAMKDYVPFLDGDKIL